MNTDKPDLHESPSPDIQTDEIQVGTKKVPNKRVCALLIDVFIINLAYSVLSAVGAGLPDIALSLLLIAYLLVRDAFLRGQSIGKYVVGLRVVDMEGQPCNLRRSGLRNLIFIVPPVIFGIVSQLFESVESAPDIPLYVSGLIFIALSIYVIEYIVMQRSSEARRLGDRVAGTKVQDMKPDRSDWWFFLFSILIVVLFFFVGPGVTPPSPG
jgi:uncharacterized RDD family membrane protein YckC